MPIFPKSKLRLREIADFFLVGFGTRNQTAGFSTPCYFTAAAAAAAAKSLQSCLTPCHPTDGGPPGSPVPGILQARTLEWVASSFSKFSATLYQVLI